MLVRARTCSEQRRLISVYIDYHSGGKNVMVAFRKTHIVCARRFALKNLKQFFNLFYLTTNVSFSSRRLVLYSSLNLSRVFLAIWSSTVDVD